MNLIGGHADEAWKVFGAPAGRRMRTGADAAGVHPGAGRFLSL